MICSLLLVSKCFVILFRIVVTNPKVWEILQEPCFPTRLLVFVLQRCCETNDLDL